MKQTKRGKGLIILLFCIAIVAVTVSIVYFTRSSASVGKDSDSEVGTADTGISSNTIISNTTANDTSQQSGKGNDLTRYYTRNRTGSIDIGVVFLTPSSADKNNLSFEVQLDNHMVDLSKYKNMNELAELDVDGMIINEGFKWTSEGSGGHHLAGTLSISNSYNEKPILKNDTKELRLILKNIEGVKKTEFVYKGNTLK